MNNTFFASIFGTLAEAPCSSIQEVSEESELDLFDDTEVDPPRFQTPPPAVDDTPNIVSALKKIDAVQYLQLNENQQQELLDTLQISELSQGDDLTKRGQSAAGLYIVISEGPALVDDTTGEIVSSGAIIDVETLLYNALDCRCNMKAGADGCSVGFLPLCHFAQWRDIRVKLMYEAVPLFRTISTTRLHTLQISHEYAEADTVIHGILVITSGVLIVKGDSPEARLFPGHIMGVREMFEQEESEGTAETYMGAARLTEQEITELMQDEPDFMIAVGESIFQRCVATEARLRRASIERIQHTPPRNLTRTQSVLTQSNIVWERKAVLRREKNLSYINEYCILRRLGTGATAAVYLCGTQAAGQVDMDHVAVKVVVRDRTGQSLQREIEALKNLIHPNIVLLLKVIDDSKCDKVFLVEEFAQGSSMTGITLNLREGQRCAMDCLSALRYMHGRGYVHRDIKPANLVRMLDGTVKLADFGCAIKIGHEEKFAFAGTPAYMPPELCVGAKVTPAVDVWALTATLHYIMYGKPPFSSYRRIELEDSIMYRPPSLGSGDMSTFTADEITLFSNLCLRGLTKDPTARITIEEMIIHPWLRSGR
jgi:CRP-like cAMP-binding protein